MLIDPSAGYSTPRTPGFPLYVNECAEFQNVFETYGRYEELKRTYRKYDPTRCVSQNHLHRFCD